MRVSARGLLSRIRASCSCLHFKVYLESSSLLLGPSMPDSARRNFKRVALGGTFDVLHKGHAALLSRAFEIGDNVTIGVTSDDLIQRLPKDHPVRPYAERVDGLRRFWRERNCSDRANLARRNDKWGPTVLERGMEAIVVTQDTRA